MLEIMNGLPRNVTPSPFSFEAVAFTPYCGPSIPRYKSKTRRTTMASASLMASFFLTLSPRRSASIAS
ncbi:MAG: hypothetical protein B7Y73_01180 [Acidocella sp. 35-58-6]|nr:MAG: hypothetical protein B7Y73_01180 [Acidocella sp. 35-58-6]